MANINFIQAKTNSYGSTKRNLANIKYIVIHNTGNKGDTAINNGNYFAKTNTRSAGAHYFIDQAGSIVQSVKLEYPAWAVGGSKYSSCSTTGGGKYYGQCTNANSVSIELCDIVNKEASAQMIASIQQVIGVIKQACPNAKTIIRHFDVTGKTCPVYYVNNTRWNNLLNKINAVPSTPVVKPTNPIPAPIVQNTSYIVQVTASNLNIRKGPGTNYAITGIIKNKGKYTIIEEKNGWGKLKSGQGWINLKYTKKI